MSQFGSQDVSKHPINKSTAKQRYSFPKQNRFQNNYKNLCDVYYDCPLYKSTRNTSFGYGIKYDFTKHSGKNPAPNVYDQGYYDLYRKNNSQNKHGYSIGLGRSEVVANGIMTDIEQPQKRNQPGPGQYPIKDSLSNIKYSMRQKTFYDDPLNSQTVKNPGPGQYTLASSINANGKYFNSKFRDSGAPYINPGNKNQNKSSKSSAPGPGNYEIKGGITARGDQFISKYQSSGCGIIGKNSRGSMATNNKVPGPGYYQPFSEFGSLPPLKSQ